MNTSAPTPPPGRHLAALIVVMLVVSATVHTLIAQERPSAFPQLLDRYLSEVVKLSTRERQQLLAGEAVTKLLEGDASKEVAVFGAIWISAPRSRYVSAVQDIETLERGGGFRITKRISSPPRLEDFERMRLSDEDSEDLRRCRVGQCEVKLGEQALTRLRSEVDWTAPAARDAANRFMQRLALEYVTQYLAGGNDQLAVYRDSARPTFVSQEFRTMVDGMPELTTYMPEMRRFLLEFPRVTMSDTSSFLYWQETEFGLKPTIRVSHLTIRDRPTDTVVASKMLYASHYFWTGLELRVLVPDPSRGEGFWFVTVNRSRSDGLSGFTGLFVRRRVRSEVQNGSLAGLRATKQRLEQAR